MKPNFEILKGWRAVDREWNTGLNLDKATECLGKHRFEVSTQQPGLYILKRPGKWWKAEFASILNRDGLFEGIPLELALCESEQGLGLRLRYDTLCAFDTGDLDIVADRLVAILQSP